MGGSNDYDVSKYHHDVGLHRRHALLTSIAESATGPFRDKSQAGPVFSPQGWTFAAAQASNRTD
jgi:hypothetical protein